MLLVTAIGTSGLLLGCSNRLSAPNELLEDVKETDLGPQYAHRVRQSSSGSVRGPADRVPQLYPGDERAASPRRFAEPADRNSVRRASDGYQLNFESANVADVAKAVLGDTLRLPYIIDARVQGQITLSTGRPVSRDDLLKVFETALRLNNGALVGDSNGYRIIPAGEAAAGDIGHIRPLQRSNESLPPGFGVTIMPLRNISSEAMLRLLDGFLARAGSARAENVGNMLLIRGTGREREQIVEIVETFDVDWLRGQSAGIFPLAHATPDEMIQELNLVVQNEQASLSANMLRFQPVPRLNAILVLARRSDHLQLAGTWIRRLDKSNAAGHQVYVYQIENGKAADIAQILNDTFGAGGGSGRRQSGRAEVAPGRDVATLQSAASGRGLQQPGFGQPPLGQPPFQSPGQSPGSTGGGQGAPGGRQAMPSVGLGSGSPPGGPGGAGPASAAIDVRIIADEANNALLIRASQSDYQKILGALRQIDRAPMQVLINATIAEVTLNDALRYGVQAYLKFAHGAHGSGGYHSGSPGDTNPETLMLRPSFPGFNLLIGSLGDPRVVLDALSSVTTVKVVSSPSVVVVDNQPATLKVGDEVPIATQQAQSTISPEAPILNTIRFRETGVILKVTPRVNSSGLVTMDVEQEISQVANAPGSPATSTLTPTISQRRIASTIAVYSGQTVALGGLISEQNNNDKRSVPLVNRIPLVGDLIGKTEIERKRTELIVFIKPQVIRNSEDASRASEELRSKLRSMAFQPAPDPHRRGWSADVRDSGVKDPQPRR